MDPKVLAKNFGVYLANELLGLDYALQLHQILDKEAIITTYLKGFQYTHKWQFTPCRKELAWLKSKKRTLHE